jgi:hypothetical protein
LSAEELYQHQDGVEAQFVEACLANNDKAGGMISNDALLNSSSGEL